jgi:hypothetical protein
MAKPKLPRRDARSERYFAQRRARHAANKAAREAYFTSPHPTGRAVPFVRKCRGDRNPFRWASVPPELRHIAEQKFQEYLGRARQRGIPLTQQKVASSMANAARYATQVATGRHAQITKRYRYLRGMWRRDRRKAALQQFAAKPLSHRTKRLPL